MNPDWHRMIVGSRKDRKKERKSKLEVGGGREGRQGEGERRKEDKKEARIISSKAWTFLKLFYSYMRKFEAKIVIRT